METTEEIQDFVKNGKLVNERAIGLKQKYKADVAIFQACGDVCIMINGCVMPTTFVKLEQSEPGEFKKVTLTLVPTRLDLINHDMQSPDILKIDWFL